MNTIKTNISKEYIIQKSKFITKLYHIFSKEEVNRILENIKKEYKDSTHICYAYILDNIKKASDDGEPNGTAGMPMLHVLEQKHLTYVLAVIIRYFGGIKLGAGGLVRTYSNCLSETVNDVAITKVIPGIVVELTYDYNNSKQIDNLLQDYKIIKKSFNEKISLTLQLPESDYDSIKPLLTQLCSLINEKERLLIC